MIGVTIDPKTDELLAISGFTLAQISQAINSQESLLITGDPMRVVTICWQDSGIMFVSSNVVKHKRQGDRIYVNAVKVTIVLRLLPVLPAGHIEPSMSLDTLFQVVADSFGIPCRCSYKGREKTLHLNAEWDGSGIKFKPAPDEDFIVQATLSPELKTWYYTWVLSLHRYRRWLESFESQSSRIQ